MLPPHVGLNWNSSKLYEFLTSVWFPCNTPSSHHFKVPVHTSEYHSMRCHTPRLTIVALTFGSLHRKSLGYSGSTCNRPSGLSIMNCCPPVAPPPLKRKAILLPLGPKSNGDDAFHQKPKYTC